jgi:hypothetical protein
MKARKGRRAEKPHPVGRPVDADGLGVALVDEAKGAIAVVVLLQSWPAAPVVLLGADTVAVIGGGEEGGGIGGIVAVGGLAQFVRPIPPEPQLLRHRARGQPPLPVAGGAVVVVAEERVRLRAVDRIGSRVQPPVHPQQPVRRVHAVVVDDGVLLALGAVPVGVELVFHQPRAQRRVRLGDRLHTTELAD